jgi:uncharacterized protein (TIGR02466 family)
MAVLSSCFSTVIYRADDVARAELPALDHACRVIAADDEAGQRWSVEKSYWGYTSYASLSDLPKRDPAFGALQRALSPHVAAFAEAAGFDLLGRPLTLDHIWINMLEPGGVHTGHIHPNSVISGTYYVAIPDGASALRFEDPRLTQMMAAPPRRADHGDRLFRAETPRAGTLLLWESWLRHEVLQNEAEDDRISISFNYRWGK